jgi:hypothetical protein
MAIFRMIQSPVIGSNQGIAQALARRLVQKPGFYAWISRISGMSQPRNRISQNAEPMLWPPMNLTRIHTL